MRSKVGISLIAIAAILATHQPCIEGNQNDTQGAHHWKFTRFQVPNLENGRFRKASGDDNLKSSVANLQMVARITNAIYLQQGLISGSIPADALISELLHFEPVKPSDIATIDISKIQTAVDALKALPNKLKPNLYAAKVETSLSAYQELLKDVRDHGNFKTWKPTELENVINQLAKDGVDTKSVSDIHDRVSAWDTYKTILLADGVTNNDANTYLKQIIASLNHFKSGSQGLASSKPYWTSTNFVSVSDGLTPAVATREAFQTYKNKSSHWLIHQQYADAYNAYIGLVSSHVAQVKNAASSLDVFNQFMNARQMDSMNRKEIKFTPGFPHDSSDLAKLDVDLKNTWMEKVIGSEDFPKSLKKLRQLEEPLENVQNVLGNIGHIELATFVDDVNLVSTSSDMVKSWIFIIQKCKLKLFFSPSTDAGLMKLKDHLTNIDQMLAEMQVKTDALTDYLKNPEIGQYCDDVIKICEKVQKADNIKTALTEFKNYANMVQLNKHMDRIWRLARAVDDADNITAEATAAKQLFKELKQYQKDSGEFLDWLSCLQKDNVYTLLDIVDKVKEIYSNDSTRATSMDSEVEAIRNVVRTKDTLKELETIISAQTSYKSIETNALTLLKDGSSHSNTIGLAVQGVTNMKNALEKRSELERLLKARDLIQNLEKRWKDPEDVSNLGSLLSLLDQIQKMIDSLDTFKKSITPSSSTTLADHSEIFQKAKSVSGASGEFEKIAGTVGKLKKLVTNAGDKKTLEDVESTLKTMDTMGLDFAKFQKSFDGSKESLSALDTFFTSFADQVEREIKSQHEAGNNFLIVLLAALVAILTVIVVVGLACWMYRFHPVVFFKIFFCYRKKKTDNGSKCDKNQDAGIEGRSVQESRSKPCAESSLEKHQATLDEKAQLR